MPVRQVGFLVPNVVAFVRRFLYLARVFMMPGMPFGYPRNLFNNGSIIQFIP